VTSSPYNAPSDGIHDATAGIQAALTAAAASSGNTVYLPAGTYLITGELSLSPSASLAGMVIRGDGIGETIITDGGTSSHAMLLLKNLAPSGTATNGAEVTQMTFTCQSGSGVSAAILAGSDGALWIHQIEVNFDEATTAPVGISCEHNVINGMIENNIFTGDGMGTAIWLNDSSFGNTVFRNTITTSTGEGIACDDSANEVVRENTVSGSTAERLGIEAWGGSAGTVIEDNVVDHWISVSGSNEVAVRRNTVNCQDSTQQSIGLELVDSQDVVFTDNLVDGPGTAVGFSMSGDDANQYHYYAYNTVQNCAMWGAQIQGNPSYDVQGVYFYNDSFLSTYSNLSNDDPTDDGHGVRLNDHIQGLAWEDCTIQNNGGDGIEIYGAGSSVDALSFLDCTIEDNALKAFSETTFNNFSWIGGDVSGNGTSNAIPANVGYATALPTVAITAVTAATTDDGLMTAVSFGSEGSSASVAQFLWDVGAGPASADSSYSYAYSRPGKYRVSLLGWNDNMWGARATQYLTISGRYEAEATPYVVASGPACSLFNEGGLSRDPDNVSGPDGLVFPATASGQTVSFTLPDVPAGTYAVEVCATEYTSRGIFQLAIGAVGTSPVNQGSPQDMYLAGGSAPGELVNLGTWTCANPGDQVFRFTITGKNSSSSGYTLALDYIELVPQ